MQGYSSESAVSNILGRVTEAEPIILTVASHPTQTCVCSRRLWALCPAPSRSTGPLTHASLHFPSRNKSGNMRACSHSNKPLLTLTSFCTLAAGEPLCIAVKLPSDLLVFHGLNWSPQQGSQTPQGSQVLQWRGALQFTNLQYSCSQHRKQHGWSWWMYSRGRWWTQALGQFKLRYLFRAGWECGMYPSVVPIFFPCYFWSDSFLRFKQSGF